jgi:hypothetical protein
VRKIRQRSLPIDFQQVLLHYPTKRVEAFTLTEPALQLSKILAVVADQAGAVLEINGIKLKCGGASGTACDAPKGVWHA